MIILHAFEWLGQTGVGIFMQQSTYAFEVVQMFHLLALAALGGGILFVDLRFLGFGLKSRSGKQLADEFMPYLVASLSCSVFTGVLMLAAESTKCYYNSAFRFKMFFLVIAVLFYLFVQRPLFMRPVPAKACAVVSLMLWLAVGLAGRAIGVI